MRTLRKRSIDGLLIATLGLAALSVGKASNNALPDAVPLCVAVTVSFSNPGANLLADSTLVKLEEAICVLPGVRYQVFVTDTTIQPFRGTLLVVFQKQTPRNLALSSIQKQIDVVKSERLSKDEMRWIVIPAPVVATLVFVHSDPTLVVQDQTAKYGWWPDEVFVELTKVPNIESPLVFESHWFVMRIKLNQEMMELRELTPEDLAKAVMDSSMIAPSAAIWETCESLEIVLTHRFVGNNPKPPVKVKYLEDVILKADEEGRICRIKDVGMVSIEPMFPSFTDARDRANNDLKMFVAKPLPGADADAFFQTVKKRFEQLMKTPSTWHPIPQGMEIQLTGDIPTAYRLPRQAPASEAQNEVESPPEVEVIPTLKGW